MSRLWVVKEAHDLPTTLQHCPRDLSILFPIPPSPFLRNVEHYEGMGKMRGDLSDPLVDRELKIISESAVRRPPNEGDLLVRNTP